MFVIIKTILVTQGGITSARKLHDNMLVRVFQAPIAFFDTTPVGMLSCLSASVGTVCSAHTANNCGTGRILNRFSKDQNGIDEGLMQAVLLFGNQAFLAISVVGVVSVGSPIFRAALIPLSMYPS